MIQRGHRDEVRDRGEDHEDVEDLVEAEHRRPRVRAARARRRSRRSCRAGRRRRSAPGTTSAARRASAGRPAPRPSRARRNRAAQIARGALIQAIDERHARQRARPDRDQHDPLRRARQHEHPDRRVGGGDEQVDVRVVDAAQHRPPARIPAPAVIEARAAEQRAQAAAVDRGGDPRRARRASTATSRPAATSAQPERVRVRDAA